MFEKYIKRRGDQFFVTDGEELHILVIGYLSMGLKIICLKHDKDRGVSRFNALIF